MNDVAIDCFRSDDLAAWATFWNRAFVGFHHAWPVTAETLRHRVLDRDTAIERFDPAGLLLARSGDAVVGMLHAGRFSEPVCRALDPGWPGGERGFVALLVVLPEFRRRGIGAGLWRAAQSVWSGCRDVVVDSRGINPWYANSVGPETPFFGTPEGIGLPAQDEVTLRFLAKRGFRPTAQVVSVAGAPAPSATPAAASGPAPAVVVVERRLPELGAPLDAALPAADAPPSLAVCITADGVVAGFAVVYEMFEAQPRLWGIWQLQIGDAWRGRGWGRALLSRALAELHSRGAVRCEAVTDPERSAAAYALYRQAGFEDVARWVLFDDAIALAAGD